MNNDDEKFFEELAEGRKPEIEVDMAKATSIKPKISVEKDIEIEEESNDYDGPEGQLTVDVYQNENEIIVESAVAGVDPDNLDINVTNDSISIKGIRHRDKEVKDHDYFYQECYWGKFSRSIILPQEIDPDRATVKFKNGILTVKLPKLDRKKMKKLKVKLN